MSGLVIRPEAGGDEAAIRALHREAFGSDTEAKLVDELRDETSFVLSLVAEEEGQVVGHVLYSRLTIDGAPTGASALAPISVDPRRRKQGLASQLIENGHRQLKADGETLVFVLGDPAFYTRFGFSAETAKAFRTPYDGPYMMTLALSPVAPASGTVAYPAPFARLG